MSRHAYAMAMAVVVVVGAGITNGAQASAVFQGRDSNGAVDNKCTGTGTTACAMFYDSILDITILNNWSIGNGIWNASASQGSAQQLAESAGFAATGLTGWVLPTGNGNYFAGPGNQYLSIWMSVASSISGLKYQFNGVQSDIYWSGSEYQPHYTAWYFHAPLAPAEFAGEFTSGEGYPIEAVAVRAGDVVASVPEPLSLPLVLLALGAGALATRRRLR